MEQETTYKESEFILSPCEIIEGKVKMLFPETFTDMPSEIYPIDYFSDLKPQLAKMGPNRKISFSFNIFPWRLKLGEIKKAGENFSKALRIKKPKFEYFDLVCESVNGHEIVLMNFKSDGRAREKYNIIFLIPLTDGLLQGTFQCPYEERNQYEEMAKKAILSVNFVGL